MRTGFEFIDLSTDDKSLLASMIGHGPKVGKYFVNLEGCRFAAERLKDAVKNSDIIICDEIGPMKLKSKEFVDSVKDLLDVDKKVIVVVHQKLQHAVTAFCCFIVSYSRPVVGQFLLLMVTNI